MRSPIHSAPRGGPFVALGFVFFGAGASSSAFPQRRSRRWRRRRRRRSTAALLAVRAPAAAARPPRLARRGGRPMARRRASSSSPAVASSVLFFGPGLLGGPPRGRLVVAVGLVEDGLRRRLRLRLRLRRRVLGRLGFRGAVLLRHLPNRYIVVGVGLIEYGLSRALSLARGLGLRRCWRLVGRPARRDRVQRRFCRFLASLCSRQASRWVSRLQNRCSTWLRAVKLFSVITVSGSGGRRARRRTYPLQVALLQPFRCPASLHTESWGVCGALWRRQRWTPSLALSTGCASLADRVRKRTRQLLSASAAGSR